MLFCWFLVLFFIFCHVLNPILHNSVIYKTILGDYQNQLEIKNKSYGLNLNKGLNVCEVDFKNKPLIKPKE
jgi:hypothetical protein